MDDIIEFLNLERFGKNIYTDESCTICLDTNVKKRKYKTKCDHIYCKTCLFQWLEKHSKCPICRSNLYDDDEFYNHFKSKLVYHMEQINEVLYILDRTDYRVDNPVYEDNILNHCLDEVLKSFIKFGIDGDTYHDYWEDFNIDSKIEYDSKEYIVLKITNTTIDDFQFITDNNKLWKVNLRLIKKDESSENNIKVDGELYNGIITIEDII